jgi:hypothetical protein
MIKACNPYHARNGRPLLLFLLPNAVHILIVQSFAKGSIMKATTKRSMTAFLIRFFHIHHNMIDAEGKPITGLVEWEFYSVYKNIDCKAHYENGDLEQEITFKNNERNGLETRYLPNGAVLEIQNINDEAVSGFCIKAAGEKTALSEREIDKINKEQSVDCK